MALPVSVSEKGIIPSLLRLSSDAHVPLWKGPNRFIVLTLIKSCQFNHLTLLSHCDLQALQTILHSHHRVSDSKSIYRAESIYRTLRVSLRGQCVTPCGRESRGEKSWMSVCMTDSQSQTGTCTWRRLQLQMTFTGPHCMCMANWTHMALLTLTCYVPSVLFFSPLGPKCGTIIINGVNCTICCSFVLKKTTTSLCWNMWLTQF